MSWSILIGYKITLIHARDFMLALEMSKCTCMYGPYVLCRSVCYELMSGRFLYQNMHCQTIIWIIASGCRKSLGAFQSSKIMKVSHCHFETKLQSQLKTCTRKHQVKTIMPKICAAPNALSVSETEKPIRERHIMGFTRYSPLPPGY